MPTTHIPSDHVRRATTEDRDRRVLKAIARKGKTRNEIAEELSEDPSKVYISLWRLHRDGLVVRGDDHYWTKAS